MKNKILPTIGIIFTVILWGLSFLSIKVAIEVIPPMTLGLLRFIIASVLLIIVVKVKNEKLKLEKKDIPLIFIAGFIGVTVYFYFENNGIKLMKASTASLVIATIPIFTLIFDSIIFKSKLSAMKVFSVIISFVGVFLLVKASTTTSDGSNTLLGYVMMFGAVLAWVMYSLFTKPLFGRYSQIVIVFYQTIIGTILFIPFALFENVNWSLVNIPIVLNVIYLGIFCSAIGYFIYVYAMENLGISTSSLYLNLLPIITVVASIFILNEGVNVLQIIGGLLIISSVYLINIEFRFKYKDKVQ